MARKKQVQPERQPLRFNRVFFSLALIAYGLVAVLTPNFKTFDSNMNLDRGTRWETWLEDGDLSGTGFAAD